MGLHQLVPFLLGDSPSQHVIDRFFLLLLVDPFERGKILSGDDLSCLATLRIYCGIVKYQIFVLLQSAPTGDSGKQRIPLPALQGILTPIKIGSKYTPRAILSALFYADSHFVGGLMKTETFNRLHEQRHRGETVHPQLESSLCERTVNVDLEDVN